jgi:hypothetical protein
MPFGERCSTVGEARARGLWRAAEPVAAGTSEIEEGSEATIIRAVGVTQTRGTSAADAAI